MSSVTEELADWAYIANNLKGRAHLMILNGDIFEDALREIALYRDALIDAVAVISTHEDYKNQHPEEILFSFINSQKKQGL